MANQKNWREKCFNNVFRVLVQFKVWEYHLSTKAVLPQYYPFGRSKYIPAQTTFRQKSDNLNYIYIYDLLPRRASFLPQGVVF